MRYWTLFTLRMVSRTGLAATLVLWLSAQWEPAGGVERKLALGELCVCTTLKPESFCLHRAMQTNVIVTGFPWYFGRSPDLQLPGLSVWVRPSLSWSVVQLDHWLLCLTFLIATIATSVRWRKRPADSEQERADE